MRQATNGRLGMAHNYWPFTPKNAEEARQGEVGGKMQWVLGTSLALIVATFTTVYAFTAIFGAHQ